MDDGLRAFDSEGTCPKCKRYCADADHMHACFFIRSPDNSERLCWTCWFCAYRWCTLTADAKGTP